jgi:nucleotide-binding universal stress UspA family protein
MKTNLDTQKRSTMNRIIIPVDASPEIGSIIEKAFALAKEIRRSVVALYIIDTPRLTEVIPLDGLSTAWESLLSKEAQKILHKIEQRGKKLGISVEKKVVEGIPEDEIIKEARKNDLIVMGCKSQGFFDRFLTTNVCEKVIDKSSSSVITYKMK